MTGEQSAEQRAREWRHDFHAAVSGALDSWEHGTIVRTPRYPTYYDVNVVRVEDEPSLSAAELTAFAEREQSGLGHRRIDFEHVAAGDGRRAELGALGWKSTRLVWMLHRRPLPVVGAEISVEEVPYEAVDGLRLAWHEEDFGETEYEQFAKASREVSETRDVQVLAVYDQGEPIAFAQLERAGRGAEVTSVYVRPDHRGGGRGTAMTAAAVAAAKDVEDVWIVADDEDRPKDLYARLGFDPVWLYMECLMLP